MSAKIQNNIYSKDYRYYNNSIFALLNFRAVDQSINNAVNIYTDGSFKYNSNRIGYAFIVEQDNNIIHSKNGFRNIGKNKKKLGALYAETFAIEQAVNYILKKDIKNTYIYTDNIYIIRALNNKLNSLNTILNSFINNLRQLLLQLEAQKQYISFRYIKGHNNNMLNDLADTFARKGRKKQCA